MGKERAAGPVNGLLTGASVFRASPPHEVGGTPSA
jgi:hypothetical protein